MIASRKVKFGLRAALGLALALIAVAASSAARTSRASLTLSKTSGGVGTHVVVLARACTKPFKQQDTLAWHDHYYWLHDAEKRPPLGVWRRIPVTRTSPTTVRAVFIVRRSDHSGRGLLDLFCGVTTGNATATFTVTH